MDAAKPKRKKSGGRAAGTPNKVTQEFRQTVQLLLDENRSNVAKWLGQVATGVAPTKERPLGIPADPAKALDLLAKLAEFAAPKLARNEVTGPDGGALTVQVIRFADNPTPQ